MKEKENLQGQLQKEKNLRQHAQEEKGTMKLDFIHKLEEKDRIIAQFELQMGLPISSRCVAHSPDFMNYIPGTPQKTQFDKKLLMDFVKLHNNQTKRNEQGKEDDAGGCAIKHRGLKQDGDDAQNDAGKTGDDANNSQTEKGNQGVKSGEVL